MKASFQRYSKKVDTLNALVLKAKKLSEQLLSGSQLSYFKGRGIIFDEVRKYQIGDDVRTIHWSITARLREPHIKLYNEEKNLTLWLLIDVSGSGSFGTRKQTKFDTIIELCALIAFAAQKSNCSVGAICFSDKIEKVILPQKGNSHCLKIIYFLVDFDITGKQTCIAKASEYVMQLARKGSLIVVLSDFMSSDYGSSFNVVNKKHELLGIRIYDRSEAAFPPASFIHMLDSETGKTTTVNTSSKQFKLCYTHWYQEKTAYFQKSFAQTGAGALEIATDEEYTEKLVRYFHKR